MSRRLWKIMVVIGLIVLPAASVGCGDAAPMLLRDSDSDDDVTDAGPDTEGDTDSSTADGDTHSTAGDEGETDSEAGGDTDSAPEAIAVGLYRPSPRAIYQRNHEDLAYVPVEGVVGDADVTAVEARWVLVEDETILGDWGEIPVPWPRFQGTLEVPVGGWYRVEVRAVDADGLPVETLSVSRVGVGEVFITAGQSNAASFGMTRDDPDDTVSAWNGVDGIWQYAADPQPLVTRGKGGRDGSPWSRLGDILTARFGVPVGFIGCAQGSSTVEQWLPETEESLYPRFELATAAAGETGFRAVLWHQGESDAADGLSADRYAERLETVIRQMRADAGWEVPWGIARASYLGGTPTEQLVPVREGQNRVLDQVAETFAGPDTDLLQGPDIRAEGQAHLAEAGLMMHALGWDQAIQQAFFSARRAVTMVEENAVFDGPAEYVLGFAFSTDAPITVTDLGRYIPDGEISTRHAEAGLWNLDGDLLADTVIPAATPIETDANGHRWRFAAIPPTPLPPGSYVVGVRTFASSVDSTFTMDSIVEISQDLNWIASRATPWYGELAFPSATGDAEGAFGGVNFKYQ